MSDSDNTTRDASSVAMISAIFEPDESTTGECLLAIPGEEKDLRSREEIEADYKSGKRDKKTVCAWMAYRAAMALCTGQPSRLSPTGDNDRFNELLMEGYQAAIKRWDTAHAPYVDPDTAPDEKARRAIKKANALRYAPAKDVGNGISGLMYETALGRMRNAANELFTKHGKRKHDKDDVLPVVIGLVANRAAHEAPAWCLPRTAPKVDTYAADDPYSDDITPTDILAIKADVGGINDKAVTAAAKKAERTKFNFKWTERVQVPGGPVASKGKTNPTSMDRNATRVSNEIAVTAMQDALARLPNREDQEILTQYGGLNGTGPMTVEELAEAHGTSVSLMRKRLENLFIEVRLLLPKTPRQSAWRDRMNALAAASEGRV